jgi:hypothetical protein
MLNNFLPPYREIPSFDLKTLAVSFAVVAVIFLLIIIFIP